MRTNENSLGILAQLSELQYADQAEVRQVASAIIISYFKENKETELVKECANYALFTTHKVQRAEDLP